ncbi:MAG TPA: hypothetical protein VLA21_07390 [Candidatus Limnocylindria bacterium]|nr:hypothetical protein [Candidatus Limnocylindria bacterium]
MAGSLWVREIRRGRIRRDLVVPCPERDFEEALREACRALDVGMPIVTDKHARDFAAFSQARFLPEHFMESISFDRLEAEYFDTEANHARPPRED